MSQVTIVMATYNGEKYVGEQIESILGSSYQDISIDIYDDGSKDDTMRILRKYEKLYPDKIHVDQNKVNKGVTLNFLQAISNTTSEYVMLCDQDDVWKQDKITLTINKMKQMEKQYGNKLPIAVFTDAIVVDHKLSVLQKSFFQSSHLNPMKHDLAHLLMENKLIGCTVMINAALRNILQSYQLPAKARLHDWWVALIAASFGKIGFLNEGTLLYRQHGNNVVGNITYLSYFKDRITSLKKQRAAILASEMQAAEFLQIYGALLSKESYTLIKHFSNLHQCNFFTRKAKIIRYGYLKTGIVRNIGLMIIV